MPAQPSQNAPAFERTPPQNIDAERSVLGAMLLNPEAVGATIEILQDNATDVFYVDAHRHLYAAMVELFRHGRPVDATTLIDQLMRQGALDKAGGASYIAELTGAVPTSANVEHYARIVLDTAIFRKLITACSRVAGEAYRGEGDVEGLLDRAESEIFSIAEQRQLNPVCCVSDLLDEGIHRIEEQMKSHSGITGLATGLHELDVILSGLQPADMIVLAARPSVGKTAFALNIAAHVTNRLGKGALIFSLEMSKEQLVHRLLCLEGEVNARRLREGFLAGNEFRKVQKAADVLSRAKLFVDDTPGIGILELRSKARRQKAMHPVDLVIIDYLQLMQGSRRAENRQVEIADISRAIKGLARELRIPVLTLCQLNREAEKDDVGMPKLSHLRESGAIEQDADVVLMLSRPPKHEEEENPNLIRVHVAKQRNGPTGQLNLLFQRETQRFRNLETRGGAPAAAAPPAGAAPPPSFDPDLDMADGFEEDEVPF